MDRNTMTERTSCCPSLHFVSFWLLLTPAEFGQVEDEAKKARETDQNLKSFGVPATTIAVR